MQVNPWEVQGSIDYDKLIKEFGTQPIKKEQLDKLKKIVGELHPLLKRGYFFSHRDLDAIIKDYESGKEFFMYTGRGPSGAMHIGHLPPFVLTKWMQEKFEVNVYIEITDDEKFLQKKQLSWDEIQKQAKEDILDIIALGFDPDKTFIFKDSEYISKAYPMMLKVAKKTTLSTAKAVFGFINETNIGMIFYPTYQVIPTFFEKKRSLIPCGIDQDPYWRIQRDIAEELGYYKAAAIHSSFLPPLQGMEGKMSSSKPETSIYLADDEKTVKNKINKYAFSGGRSTLEEHRKLGGNPDIDVSFQYLKILFEPDDKKLIQIEKDYRSGKLLTGELKQYAIQKINEFLKQHRENRKNTEKLYDKFMYTGKLAKKMWGKD